MESMTNTSRSCGERGHLLSRKVSHQLASCSRALQGSLLPPRHKRQCLHPQTESSRFAITAKAAEAAVAFQSVDDSVWDERYADEGPLQYGLATLQGPRDEMEDYASIVPRGRCGFLYAGALAFPRRTVSLLYFCRGNVSPIPTVLLQQYLMDMEGTLPQTI